jgi:hypothetical protein
MQRPDSATHCLHGKVFGLPYVWQHPRLTYEFIILRNLDYYDYGNLLRAAFAGLAPDRCILPHALELSVGCYSEDSGLTHSPYWLLVGEMC